MRDNPGLKIKQQRRILVAVDTSGSVSKDELLEFFQEIYHMSKLATDVVVLQCDAEVQDVSDFSEFQKTLHEGKVAIHGRGGTSFPTAVDYYNEHKKEFSCMIYLTDGEAPMPENKPLGSILCAHRRWVRHSTTRPSMYGSFRQHASQQLAEIRHAGTYKTERVIIRRKAARFA